MGQSGGHRAASDGMQIALIGRLFDPTASSHNKLEELFFQIKRILTSGYGDKKLLYVNDIALVELEQDVTINANVLPICIDWRRAHQPLQKGDNGLVS